MYRLTLYILIGLLLIAGIFSIFGFLNLNIFSLIISITLLILVCWITNTIFAKTFNVVTNVESVYISALILALVIAPVKSLEDLIVLGLVGILAVASKYILAFNKKHIFNPVGFSLVLIIFTLNQSASWWIGTYVMMPFVIIGGFLIIRKIKRFYLVLSFLSTGLIVIMGISLFNGVEPFSLIKSMFTDTPILFFAFIMLTEPQTTPPTKILQVIYGVLVGFLFAPQIHLGPIYSTPEVSLVIGNIFSYIVSPKQKLILKLKNKIKIAPDIFDFVFNSNQKLAFTPGQYLEWTLGQKNTDSRGNRRYFTVASSPTEETIRIGVKFYDNGSSFKKTLISMEQGGEIIASQLAGEFILPKDPLKKLVFIAGGIGVTPFRSIIKYLLDINQKRDIVILYSVKNYADFVYSNLFEEAKKKLGIKIINIVSDTKGTPLSWQGKTGFITDQVIKEEIPDFKDRIFYISGPHAMITAFEKTLSSLGLNKSQIKTDFFPGFA